MNLIIDITVSKEFSTKTIKKDFAGNSELVRRDEKKALVKLLLPLLDNGYTIVVNTTMRNS